MKTHYKTRDGRLMFEAEGETVTALFKAVARFQEIFDSDSECGRCGNDRLQYVVRTVEENEFYEKWCTAENCHARLEFGQHRKGGTLFAKRKTDKGEPLPDRGWAIYKRIEGPKKTTPAPGGTRARNA